MIIARFDLLRGRISAALVQKIGLVLKLVGDDFVRVVICDGEEICGFVGDEFLGEEIRICIIVGGNDTFFGIGAEGGRGGGRGEG